MTLADSNAQPESGVNKLYAAAWRWHFYAGLFVIPFLTTLAITGAAMLWIAWIDGRDGERTLVVPQEITLPISVQAEAAVATIPDGVLKQYVAPRTNDVAALFRVDHNGDAIMVAVDPYTAQVIETFPRRSGWYDFADNIHSNLMLGVSGDRMLETAASLALVLIATGLYMWWPRNIGWRKALIPSFGQGRSL
jgi:uncharacterized iron-regulated membrane protein